ncbi:hypothetical protein BD560DRAFT_344475, partial [Blakeslea trispora]
MKPWVQTQQSDDQKHTELYSTSKGNENDSDSSNTNINHDKMLCPASLKFANDRKLWSEEILQNITGLLHVLSPFGTILYCSNSCVELTGYYPHELAGRMWIDFVHVDDLDVFTRMIQFTSYSMSRSTTYFRFRCKNNAYLLFESIGQWKHDMFEQFPKSFFAIAQPYSSQSSSLLDSFLEIKAENEWLRKRLNDLLSQEGSPKRDSQAQVQQDKPTVLDIYSSQTMSPQQQPNTNIVVPALLEEENYRETSSTDMRHWSEYQYKIPSVKKGEKTTFKHQLDDDSKSLTSQKKHKVKDNFVCTYCGTSSSPEWRRGPLGPKTLCNACGLRWSKKNRKN